MKRASAGALLAVLFWLTAEAVSTVIPFQLIELEGRYIKWGPAVMGTPARVTVGFVDRVMSAPQAGDCGEMRPVTPALDAMRISNEDFRAEVRHALDAWQRVAGIRFDIVEEPRYADILIGAQNVPRGLAFANVMYRASENRAIRALVRSYVCLNPAQQWKVGFDGRLNVYDLRYTIAHEIGHAIGLSHPGPPGQLMSFKYSEAIREPQFGDIAGAVLLYGPPVHSVAQH